MPQWGKKKLKKSKLKSVFIIVVIIFLLIYLLFLYVESNIEPILIDIATARTKQIATNSINESISKEIAKNTNFEDLIQYEHDNNGRISAVTFNYSEFAKIVGSSTKCIENTLNDLEKFQESIKVGAIIKSNILADIGPSIPITIIPIGSVQVSPRAEYQNAGINVVIMTVMIDVYTELQVVVPFSTEPTIIETSIPIVQAQVFGEVPQFYFEGQGMSSNNDMNYSYIPPLQVINNTENGDNLEEVKETDEVVIQTASEQIKSVPGFEAFYPVISN